MGRHKKVYTEAELTLKRQRIKEYHQKYREDNRDNLRQYNNKYRKDHPESKPARNAATKRHIARQKATNLDYIIADKIHNHLTHDKEAKRIHEGFNYSFYVNVAWVKEQLTAVNNKCYHCDKVCKLVGFRKYDPEQFTLDRIVNDLPHEKDNCVISCLKCNLKGKNLGALTY